MVDLAEKTPCADVLPLSIGQMRLTEARYATITGIAPFAGQQAAVSATLQAQVGVGLPVANQCLRYGDTSVVWAGVSGVLVCGPKRPEVAGAAVTDQSDGWAVVRLTGEGAVDALARLVPVDLRPRHFAPDQAARTMLAHLSVIVTGLPGGFEIMTMRSMAKTLVHDLHGAMQSVAARAALSAART